MDMRYLEQDEEKKQNIINLCNKFIVFVDISGFNFVW